MTRHIVLFIRLVPIRNYIALKQKFVRSNAFIGLVPIRNYIALKQKFVDFLDILRLVPIRNYIALKQMSTIVPYRLQFSTYTKLHRSKTLY